MKNAEYPRDFPVPFGNEFSDSVKTVYDCKIILENINISYRYLSVDFMAGQLSLFPLNTRKTRPAIQKQLPRGSADMEISTRMTESTLIIDVKGEISSLHGIDLDKKIIRKIEEKPPKRLIINLKGVDYIDSQGMGSLIIIRQYTIKNKILFSVVEINENIRKTFEHSEMVDFFNIRDSEEQLL